MLKLRGYIFLLGIPIFGIGNPIFLIGFLSQSYEELTKS